MNVKKKLMRIIIPVVIVLAGFLGMRILVLSRPAPQKKVRVTPGPLVEVLTVKKTNHKIIVNGTGTVQPRMEASITPQVSGKVTFLAPNFVPGGFFKKGDLLFEIEAIDYRLALERAQTNLEKLEHEYLRSETLYKNKMISEQELERVRDNYKTSLTALKQTKLDLERTSVYAPFNCRVRSEQIDPGQYLRSGTSVAIVAGTDTAEIEIPLPLEELHWLDIPRHGYEIKGSNATVIVSTGNQIFRWEGSVVRSLGEVDTQGRMARIVVAVDDPYHLRSRPDKVQPDLKTGMFVEVELHGKTISGAFTIPRGALRENSSVWAVDKDNKLRSRAVTVSRRERESLIILEGLNNDERILISTVSGAADGMVVRPAEKGEI